MTFKTRTVVSKEIDAAESPGELLLCCLSKKRKVTSPGFRIQFAGREEDARKER